MAAKKEGIYTTAFIRWLNKDGFAFKIPDPSPGGYATVKRPFDVVGLYEGHYYAYECKWIKEPAAFGGRHLRPHQIDGLNKVKANGGHPSTVLFTRYNKKVRAVIFEYPFEKKTITKAEVIAKLASAFSLVLFKGEFILAKDLPCTRSTPSTQT
jgi:hypothetical protein